jgi:hypothetical protein
MEIIYEICLWFSFIQYAAICIAGLKGAIMHNGIGSFELIGKLWRGEIKSKHHG